MNYEDMSDFEINTKVALIKYQGLTQLESEGDGVFVSRVDDKYDFVNIVHSNFDPCNSPSDAWPVIIENNISISHSTVLYRADALVYDKKFDSGFKIFKQDSQLGDTSSRGALRAAMICFLKMKDAEQ